MKAMLFNLQIPLQSLLNSFVKVLGVNVIYLKRTKISPSEHHVFLPGEFLEIILDVSQSEMTISKAVFGPANQMETLDL